MDVDVGKRDEIVEGFEKLTVCQVSRKLYDTRSKFIRIVTTQKIAIIILDIFSYITFFYN